MKTTPKDFFLYIGVMVTLYLSTVSFLTVVFQIVNYAFPDVLYTSFDPYSGAMRFAIATLIIVFPLFILFSRLINNDILKEPGKRDIAIRKWLTYLTLFIAGGAVAVDLIVLINTFLGGEITTRFGLKVLAVLVVSGAVFWYYLSDLRGVIPRKRAQLFGGVVAVVILITLITGFVYVGSPMTQRDLRFDDQKIRDLSAIQENLINYWQLKAQLPGSLDELNDSLSYFKVPVDPQTGEEYEYIRTDGLAFELCANFNLESRSLESRPVPAVGRGNLDLWNHGAGRHCFERTIDPQIYPTRIPN